jgi:ATP-dependent Clp protease adaptor protein ClpS
MTSSIALPDVGQEVGVGNETTEDRSKPYHVILLDDNDHTADYVIGMLIDLFRFSREKSTRHMLEVDGEGHSRLCTLPLAEAELKRDQIHAYGPDPRLPHCLGAMAALIEPAE